MPPVETISTPSSLSPRAKSTIPALSETDSSARFTRTSPGAARSSPTPEPSVKSLAGAMPAAYPAITIAALVARVDAQRTAREQPDRLWQQRRAPVGAAPSAPLPASRAFGNSTARWEITGPLSTPSSTKCTVTPNTFTPYAQRLLDRLQPREGRQQRRMDVDHRSREALEERLAQQLHVPREHHQPRAMLRAASPPSPRRAPCGPRTPRGETPPSAPRARAARSSAGASATLDATATTSRLVPVHRVEQRLQVRARARHEHGDRQSALHGGDSAIGRGRGWTSAMQACSEAFASAVVR